MFLSRPFQVYSSKGTSCSFSQYLTTLSNCDKVTLSNLQEIKMSSSFYLYRIKEDAHMFYGYGISGDLDNRHKTHIKTAKQSGASINLIFVRDFSNDGEAEALESFLKENFKVSGTKLYGFITESFSVEDFDDAFKAIRTLAFDKPIVKQLLRTGNYNAEVQRRYNLRKKYGVKATVENDFIVDMVFCKDIQSRIKAFNLLCDLYKTASVCGMSVEQFLDVSKKEGALKTLREWD